MDDSGFPRTPDRSVKLLGTCVRYLRSVETPIGARGPDFLGGSATKITHSFPSNSCIKADPIVWLSVDTYNLKGLPC